MSNGGIYAALMTLCLATPATGEALRIATTAEYAPFLVPQSDGTMSGVEGDLIAALCLQGGWTCDWQVLSLGDLFAALERGTVDLGAAGLGSVSNRESAVMMACPHLPRHLSGGQGTLYVLDPMHDPRSGPIATVRDTVFVDRLVEDGLDLRLYPDFDAAVAAVAAGEVPAYFGGSRGIDERPGGASLTPVEDLDISGRGISLAVTATRPDLLQDINAHLAALSADGTITDIWARWTNRHVPDPVADCVAEPIS